MKTTVHTLVIDDHSSGLEVCVHPSEASLHCALKSIIEARLDEAEDWADEKNEERVEEIRQLLTEDKIDEAWDLFADDENNVKHPENYYYVEAHEIEITTTMRRYITPATREDAESIFSSGGKLWGMSEMDGGFSEITSLEMLAAYTPDSLLAVGPTFDA